jgi:PHD/YefM family antitoxin component YafN of YafNO toxin-antitoxin module
MSMAYTYGYLWVRVQRIGEGAASTGETMGQAVTYPVIDPTIKHVGVSKLRQLNAATLKETQDTFVIQENNTPLAVLLRYEKFLSMQQQLMSVLNTLELMSKQKELEGLLAGIKDMQAGRVVSLAEVEAELGKKK